MIADLVSTIIPVHNRARLLMEAVASVVAQSHRPIEIIVVDDGSTDDTPQAIGAIAARHPQIVRALHQSNAGPGRARQRGLDAARGAFVQFLDSDDLLLPRKLELQVAALRANPECGAAYGKTRSYRIGETPRDVPLKRTGEKIDAMFPAHLGSRWWSTSTPLYRHALLQRIGPWTDLRNEEDWEYECRLAAAGTRLSFCPAFVSDTRYHADEHLGGFARPCVERIRDRAEARRLIYASAQRAGLGANLPEMQHFARGLFHLSRQCGAAGHARQAQALFELARAASTQERAGSLEFRVYAGAAELLGWCAAGQLAACLDRWREASRPPARADGVSLEGAPARDRPTGLAQDQAR